MGELAAFLGIAILVIVTPGQDTALMIRNSLLGGRRAGVATAARNRVRAGVLDDRGEHRPGGAARGLGAGVRRDSGSPARPTSSTSACRRCGTRSGRPHGKSTASPLARLAPARAFRQGLLSNLGNPKIAVFFTSLLPQFGSSFWSLLALGLLFASLGLVWLSAYSFAVARAGDLLRRPRIRRSLDALTGAVLVAFGFRLAAER